MSNNDVDAKAFFRQYAAEIAEALREQEDGPRPLSVEESVSELYRSLCFDEPIIDSTSANFSVVVSSLSRQLLSNTSPYSLSDRLVNGVIYLSKRSSTNSTTPQGTVKSQDSIAIAKLAFCVFVQVPLCACENINDIAAVRKYLGSYKGSLSRATDSTDAKTSGENDAKVEHAVQQLSEGLREMAVSPPVGDNADDNDSLKEVWAAESDPSDYDYGEGAPDLPQPSSFQFKEDDWLDPIRLSKPDTGLSLDQAQFAVGSLLKHASYNVLEPLFSLSNKEVASFTSDLSQLIFSLLQPTSPLSSSDTDMDASLQDAILSPLWVLRDAAIYSLSKKQQQQGLDSTYLDVLHTLLAVDQAHLQDLGADASPTSKTADLCTASIVGLSALSSWCGMAEISTPSTISSVIDAMNDISHVMERAGSQYKTNLLHSVIPMLELLSGITYDKAKNIPSNSKIAQTLLNSGFLRQLLLIGLSGGDWSTTPHFHHALWGLSVAHPTTVGKYVARYPQTKDLIRHYSIATDSTPKQCVASVLWNGFGWIHTDALAGQAPRVVWKTKEAQQKAAAPPLSKEECLEVCQKAWTRVCQLVESSLQTADKDLEGATETLDEWERLFSFVSIMSVSPSFHELLDDSQVQSVAKCLSSIPQLEREEPEPIQEEDDDAVADPDDKRKKPKSTHHLVLSRARKLIKQYTLFFQGRGGSSKTD